MKERNEIPARQAAQRLGVGLSYLYHLVWTGKLPAHKQDGRWFIPTTAVEARLKAREAKDGTARS
jgi:excisionase family DNA binding protein